MLVRVMGNWPGADAEPAKERKMELSQMHSRKNWWSTATEALQLTCITIEEEEDQWTFGKQIWSKKCGQQVSS